MRIPFTSLKYHLLTLEKHGLIISRKDGKYNRYFTTLEVSEEEKKILNCFRKRTTLHIILWFFIGVQCTQKDLSRFLEKHPATIGFHLRNMIRAGIVENKPIANGIIYKEHPPHIIKRNQVSSEKIFVLKDPWRIYDLLIKHKKNLNDKKMVEFLIEHVEFLYNRWDSASGTKSGRNNKFNRECLLWVFLSTFFLFLIRMLRRKNFKLTYLILQYI